MEYTDKYILEVKQKVIDDLMFQIGKFIYYPKGKLTYGDVIQFLKVEKDKLVTKNRP